MTYLVDLTIILQSVLLARLEHQLEEKMTDDNIYELVYEFHCSEKKKRIHETILEFTEVQHRLTKDNVVDKIQSLIAENEVKFMSAAPTYYLLYISWTNAIGNTGPTSIIT